MAQKVREIMTTGPATVPTQAPVSEAARLTQSSSRRGGPKQWRHPGAAEI